MLLLNVFEDSNLKVEFNCEKTGENVSDVVSKFYNKSQSELHNLSF